MAKAKAGRDSKQMLGQFMTPPKLAADVMNRMGVDFDKDSKVLEPSFGDGAFIFETVERLITVHGNRNKKTLARIFSEQIYAVEIDRDLFVQTTNEVKNRYGDVPLENFLNCDFFEEIYPGVQFNFIIGNPPYGGTFDPRLEDRLDKKFGNWNGINLKKETYSFFIAKSLEMLSMGGEVVFITSDTFLTINTMSGLRHRLMDQATCRVINLDFFSEETNQPVLILGAKKGNGSDHIVYDGEIVNREEMEITGNFSWRVSAQMKKYFSGASLGDYIVCTSGMTIGNNEQFVRDIVEGCIYEPYEFEFFEDPITLAKEIERARLNKISDGVTRRIKEQEQSGETKRNVKFIKRPSPIKITLPSNDYRFYNKASNGVVYRAPKHAVYWKDQGDAVLTYKKNGNWYLHGVGGKNYFGREGMTWQLVAPRINMRFLPEGYILDSGAPCGFLRDGVDGDEFWFIFAWTLTDKATEILKTVINHTRNIQSKDIERLPYPFWVNLTNKTQAIEMLKRMVSEGLEGKHFETSSPEIAELETLFAFN